MGRRPEAAAESEDGECGGGGWEGWRGVAPLATVATGGGPPPPMTQSASARCRCAPVGGVLVGSGGTPITQPRVAQLFSPSLRPIRCSSAASAAHRSRSTGAPCRGPRLCSRQKLMKLLPGSAAGSACGDRPLTSRAASVASRSSSRGSGKVNRVRLPPRQ